MSKSESKWRLNYFTPRSEIPLTPHCYPRRRDRSQRRGPVRRRQAGVYCVPEKFGADQGREQLLTQPVWPTLETYRTRNQRSLPSCKTMVPKRWKEGKTKARWSTKAGKANTWAGAGHPSILDRVPATPSALSGGSTTQTVQSSRGAILPQRQSPLPPPQYLLEAGTESQSDLPIETTTLKL